MKYWITPRLTPSLMRCLESEGVGERVCFKKMNGIIFMHVQAHLHRLDARMHALDRCVCRHIHAPNRFNCACTCIKFASMASKVHASRPRQTPLPHRDHGDDARRNCTHVQRRHPRAYLSLGRCVCMRGKVCGGMHPCVRVRSLRSLELERHALRCT